MMFSRTRGSTSFIDVMLPLPICRCDPEWAADTVKHAYYTNRASKINHAPASTLPDTKDPLQSRITSTAEPFGPFKPHNACMQAHRRGFQKWKWGHNTPRHWVWCLNCSVFWHQSQTGVKGIQTDLRPPPRVMLVHCSADTRFNFTTE